jgi:hypothetical protein
MSKFKNKSDSLDESEMCTTKDFQLLGAKYSTGIPIFQSLPTYIDEPLDVALLEVEEYRGIIEVGQVGHILTAVILGRVHLRLKRNVQYYRYNCIVKICHRRSSYPFFERALNFKHTHV